MRSRSRSMAMRATLLFLSCLFLVAATAGLLRAQDIDATQSNAADSVDGGTYPQIVRLRYLEGDVRVARGEAIEKSADTVWEKAAVDLPLETGFNLATGSGRAEIEFEDGSTVYLGENSALAFDDLHTTADVPYTELNLLSGTATLDLHPGVEGDTFAVKTPTDRITTAYPRTRYVRVTSYLDAIAMTPLTQVAGQKTTVGKTVLYNDGRVVTAEVKDSPMSVAEWDEWVANRVALKAAELNAAATASGLPASTPGLAEMNGQGVFFSCAPYGTCWEPPAEASAQETQVDAHVSNAGPDFNIVMSPSAVTIHAGEKTRTVLSPVGLSGFTFPIDLSAVLPAEISCVGACTGQISPGQVLPMAFEAAKTVAPGTYPVTIKAASGPVAHVFTFNIYVVPFGDAEALPFEAAEIAAPDFPCFPSGVRPITVRVSGASYGWAVCHTGSWIFRHNMYVWVVPRKDDRGGGKRGDDHHHHHHHPPIRWIKCGKAYCYVPRHPHDRPGERPINWKHEVYRIGDKKGRSVERVRLAARDKVELLDQAPKQFQRPEPMRLARADAPMIRAHEISHDFGERSGLPESGSGPYLKFDKKSQHFLLAREVLDGKHVKTVTESFEQHDTTFRMNNNHEEYRGEQHGGGNRISVPEPSRVHSSASHGSGGGGTHAAGRMSHAGGGISHSGGSHGGGASHHGGGAHSGGGSHSGGSHSGGGSHGGGSHTGSHH